jgi:hypothetical protein
VISWFQASAFTNGGSTCAPLRLGDYGDDTSDEDDDDEKATNQQEEAKAKAKNVVKPVLPVRPKIALPPPSSLDLPDWAATLASKVGGCSSTSSRIQF